MPDVTYDRDDEGAEEAGALLDASPETDHLAALGPGTVVDGKYRVERILGRGGMGVVVQATHQGLSEQVALKFLQVKDADLEGDFRARFALEARVCARLRNEHIARVHDVGIWREKIPFMVMDYLEGTDLRREIRRCGRLPVARAVDCVVQICEGLAEAHGKGIVHRDLKPSNIFLTKRRDGSELVKVLDFGISKWASEAEGTGELTKTGMMLGSPKYMSPEQLNGEAIDARADVWSLGAMLYAMLTGRPPFDFAQVAQTFLAIASGAVPPAPSTIEPGVPPELDAVILRCLARERGERVQNVAELAGAALEAIDSPFAHQVRDVLYGALEPGTISSSRPRASLQSMSTGSHAAFAMGNGTLSVTPRAIDMAGVLESQAPAAAKESASRKRARAWWAVAGGVALAAVVAMGAGARGEAAGAAAAQSTRTRGVTVKRLVAERGTVVAQEPRAAAVQARGWTKVAARKAEVVTAPSAATAQVEVAARAVVASPVAPAAGKAAGALDERQ